MGVLKFPFPQPSNDASIDILSYQTQIIDINDYEILEETSIQNPRIKRKQLKSHNRSYDFRELGVDARRRGSKHQRRKQNFSDLLDMLGDEDVLPEDHMMTAFAELFMDENKMKVWEGFMNLPEDEQIKYLDNVHNVTDEGHNHESCSEDDLHYLLIDKKIRDMLRSKKLANDGLLKYFEKDVVSCMVEMFPSVLILQHDKGYDRMLIYGLCQYMQLKSNTIKLNSSTFIEIEHTQDDWKPPDIQLTQYLQNNLHRKMI